ncbi:hypothetical protein NDU88_001063 [Pleurodeles waltl]|uniref:Uncharacterized protein n=1 Tax=Pleurodeles waltl TaxID=8319 RepID=A0AAV7MJZ0_PLEWA|nr:hypothetical protein NDU88_001063 [Pleurodeles waltl]
MPAKPLPDGSSVPLVDLYVYFFFSELALQAQPVGRYSREALGAVTEAAVLSLGISLSSSIPGCHSWSSAVEPQSAGLYPRLCLQQCVVESLGISLSSSIPGCHCGASTCGPLPLGGAVPRRCRHRAAAPGCRRAGSAGGRVPRLCHGRAGAVSCSRGGGARVPLPPQRPAARGYGPVLPRTLRELSCIQERLTSVPSEIPVLS